MKTKIDRITKLCKFLELDEKLVKLPYRAYDELIKGIDRDDSCAFLHLSDGKVKIETWMESHHNGSPYGEKVKVVKVTPEMLDILIADLTEKSLVKMKRDDETERQRAYEADLRHRLEFKINQK